MGRLTGRKRTEVFAIHHWLQGVYGTENPFTAGLAHRLAQTNSELVFGTWSIDRFTECLDVLVAHRYLAVQTPAGQPKQYVISTTIGKRKQARDTLPLAIEAIKAATNEHPATIKQIEASGHKSQMIRTAIDILLALGIVKSTGNQATIEITWDQRQEQALKTTEDSTKEYYRLTKEIEDFDGEVEVLNQQLEEHDANPTSSPQPPASESSDSDE
jgi:hypothetical protein